MEDSVLILIVDDEYWARKSLKRLCEDVIGENEIKEFDNCHDVIEFGGITNRQLPLASQTNRLLSQTTKAVYQTYQYK